MHIPPRPMYNKGFLPNLSTRIKATKVIKKLMSPIMMVINKVSWSEEKPRDLNIVGA